MKRTMELLGRVPTLRAVPILGLLALMAVAPTAKAAFVTGEFAPGSTSVRVTPNELLFYNLGVTLTQPTGQFQILVPATGSFAPLLGSTNTIQDLTRLSPDLSCPGCAYAPTNTPLAINDFMRLPTVLTSITIELTGIAAAVDTPGTAICGTLTAAQLSAAGTTCSPDATSPFLLKNILDTSTGGVNTSVNFSGSGLAWFLTSPTDKSTASINFSTSFTATTILQLLNTLSTVGFVDSSLQGDVRVSAIPEPGTLSLAGLALVALGLMKRRRARS